MGLQGGCDVVQVVTEHRCGRHVSSLARAPAYPAQGAFQAGSEGGPRLGKDLFAVTYVGSKIRVLYSFPHKLGADRICNTAWHQVEGVSAAGAAVTVWTGSVARAVPERVVLHTSLAWKQLRIPYRLVGGKRACYLHDVIVANYLRRHKGEFDVVHAWPLGALHTLEEAKRLGIPTVLERPNAHTRYAYEVVRRECERIGVYMPTGHEHAYKSDVLEREEREFALADRLLCPSEFVAGSFRDEGFPEFKLLRTQYGFDEKRFYPAIRQCRAERGLTVLFAGGCAPRKGLHFALRAWLGSTAHRMGELLIAGAFIPGYAEVMANELAHRSVRVLGHRGDLPELMRGADILVLPTLEEGSALVTYEARASGCVLLVSDAAGAVCQHEKDALVHAAGDVDALTRHFDLVDRDRDLLRRLRDSSLATRSQITWGAAGKRLLDAYREAMRKWEG